MIGHNDLVTGENPDRLFKNPAPCLFAGLGLVCLALLLAFFFKGGSVGLLLAAGILATGAGIAIKPWRRWVLTLGVVNFFLGGLVAVVSRRIWNQAGMDESVVSLLWLASLVCFFAFLATFLSPGLRRAGISFLILIHFVGILTAMSMAPPAPWLASKLWFRIYRPYLQFTYLNNAYHFYAPEPSPAGLMWYRIEYESDPEGEQNYRWVMVPDLNGGRPFRRETASEINRDSGIQKTRDLSLAMTIGQKFVQPNEGTLKTLRELRQRRGVLDDISMHPSLPLSQQYREPSALAKHWIASYARHVSRTYKHKEKPHLKAIGVKVYYVVHRIPFPYEMLPGPAAGSTAQNASHKLDDPTSYFPYYMGEFNADGTMKTSCFRLTVDPFGNSNKLDFRKRDPYLYWLIPILPRGVNANTEATDHSDELVENFVRRHAGDPESDFETESRETQR